jgi:pyruvate/2-oxoglutarate/acetoin dehydrogenase E1 component
MIKLTYANAIKDGHRIALLRDERCFIIGQGVNSPWFVGTTTTGLIEEFGHERIMDTPISEAAVTGAAIGAAMSGMHPIVFHPRMDFMYLTLDQVVNHCASWNYMFDGKVNVPIVIRGIVNRGGEQGAQHSQSPFAVYANIPGLKVVCPATPYDAKGLLLAALADPNPVIYIDDRWLYDLEQEIPEDYYITEIGKADIALEGRDVTIIAASYMVKEALTAAKQLSELDISCEVIDLRSLKPLDMDTVNCSVAKTKRAVIAIAEWGFASVTSQIAKEIYTENYNNLKHKVELVNLPDAPAPASRSLEAVYYPKYQNISEAVKKCMNL